MNRGYADLGSRVQRVLDAFPRRAAPRPKRQLTEPSPGLWEHSYPKLRPHPCFDLGVRGSYLSTFLVVALLCVSGCGSSDDGGALTKGEYEAAINSVGEGIGPAKTEAEISVREARDEGELASAFEAYADASEAAGIAYDELAAPSDIAQENQSFADLALRTAVFYRELASDIRAGDVPVSEAAISREINEFLFAEENQEAMRSFSSVIGAGDYAINTTPFE